MNVAPLGLLAQTLRGLDVPEKDAARLAAAIVDFRDADSERVLGGQEQDDYLAAGLRHGPKNAPFDSIDELDQVAGFSLDQFERMRDLVTIYSRSAFVDRTLAPPELNFVLAKGTRGSDITQHPKAYRNGDPLPAPASITGTSRTIRIIAAVRGKNGGAFARTALIELAPLKAVGFEFRDWSSGHLVDPVGSEASPDAPLCEEALKAR